MKEIILICAVTSTFIFGYLIVKKLDAFLDENHRQISGLWEAPALRIAFETPALITSVSDLLECFSRKSPNCEIYLFSGTADEIVKKLDTNEIDFGFITTNLVNISGEKYDFVSIPIKKNAITLEEIGLPVLPLEISEIMTRIIWKENGYNQSREVFAEQLLNQISPKERTEI